MLIVEDDASVAELGRLVLDDEGYDCVLAHDAVAARASIAERAIDLLLADVVRPGGSSGADLAEEMQSGGARILLMSGEYRALGKLAAAGIAHLEKPFRVPELLSRVRDALDIAPGISERQ
jgi:DNA-binding response OmpR family regulator